MRCIPLPLLRPYGLTHWHSAGRGRDALWAGRGTAGVVSPKGSAVQWIGSGVAAGLTSTEHSKAADTRPPMLGLVE